MELLTFWNGEKANGDDRISMASSNSIVNISNGKIQWMVFDMTGGDRNSRLISTQDDRAEH